MHDYIAMLGNMRQGDQRVLGCKHLKVIVSKVLDIYKLEFNSNTYLTLGSPILCDINLAARYLYDWVGD